MMKSVTFVESQRHRLPNAIYSLGCYYHHGKHGFPQDYSKGLELYHQAGEFGHVAAYRSIGTLYSKSEGVEIVKRKTYTLRTFMNCSS